MSGTAKSLSQLYAEFPSGGVANITAQNVRDLVTSVPLWDDPGNSSGLGAPAILRGTVEAHLSAGVTQGAGQTLGVRQATYTGLQNAINYAVANGKFFEIEPGIYEYYSATPLTIPVPSAGELGGLTWRGTPNSRIIQFYTTTPGTPAFVVGDITNANYAWHIDMDGAAFEYGATQTGFTSSVNLAIGGLTNCSFANIRVGGGSGSFQPYNCMTFTTGGALTATFSCKFSNFNLNGAQANYANFLSLGTGNLFENFYINGSGNSITGSMFVASSSGYTEQNFDQFNLEHCSCNIAMNLSFGAGATFSHTHFEDVTMTGANPSLIQTNGGVYAFEQLTLTDPKFLTANMSGTGSVIADYTPGNSVIKVKNFIWQCNTASHVNAPVNFLTLSGLPADTVTEATIEGALISDYTGGNLAGNFSLDSHMPVGANAFLFPNKFNRYDYGKSGSRVDSPVIAVSATYTHYGQLRNATLVVPASITGFTITLAAVQGATGTQAVITGTVCNVRRATGSPSGTLLVKDDAGTTLTTSTTAATDYWYIFNGTHYVTFTPVT